MKIFDNRQKSSALHLTMCCCIRMLASADGKMEATTLNIGPKAPAKGKDEKKDDKK